MRNKMPRLRFGLVAASMLLSAATPLYAQTVTAVLEGDLKVLDPYATNAYITRNAAYLYYDTLLDVTASGEIKPQMLDSWTISPDGMTYDFKLRSGLMFHDGAPVTAEDAVASIQRFEARRPTGKMLASYSKELVVTGNDSFRLVLKEPFGHVITTLANPIFVMPARFARQDSKEPVTDPIGSGPFMFNKKKWVPGSKAVFDKFSGYKPRGEAADGFTGGKVVKVDSVVFRTIEDPATRIAALQAGEVDYVERVPFDLLPLIQSDPSVKISKPVGNSIKLGWLSFQNAHPPFNDPRIRRAAAHAINAKEIMAAMGIPADMARPDCRSIYTCDSIYTNEGGVIAYDPKKAKELLAEAGYDGTPVLSLHTTNISTISTPASVIEDQLRRVGFNIKTAAGEFNTVFTRWYNNEPVDKGGWSMLVMHINRDDLANPINNYFVSSNCNGNFPGKVCVQAAADKFREFLRESDVTKGKALAKDIQIGLYSGASSASWGQFAIPSAWRHELKGFISMGVPIFWNVTK